MVTSVTARPRRLATRLRVLAFLTASGVLAAACGAPPGPPPSAAPTPVVTPDPHLDDPATAQEVFNGLGRAGLRITPNTATAGDRDSDIVTKIFATYVGWPLDVVQYRSTAALTGVTKWAPDEVPGRGEAAIAIAGSNILVIWGPRTSGMKPGKPDERQQEGLTRLVRALDGLLSPLRARAIVPVSIAASVAAAPASPAPSPAPKATPAP